MSTVPSNVNKDSRAASKSQRALACVLCQQRKVRCDRKSPCANCARAGAQCVPATLAPRQRRRRFPERELLERIRHYEGLLSQTDIKFEPLHPRVAVNTSSSEGGRLSGAPEDVQLERPVAAADRTPKEKANAGSEPVYKAKNIWDAMNQQSQDREDREDSEDSSDENDNDNDSDSLHGDLREAMLKKTWDRLSRSNDHLLFGSRETNFDLSSLHPEQVQIFRLWQIYLENVDPLLKVTHTPTLQARIIDAACDVSNMNPTFQALMFSIYCVSILSLTEEDCYTMFKSSREDLLTSYKFGCQQALLNCGLLRSNDHECLTAFYLYLISVRMDTDPRSVSSMLSVAVRMAQRMGIHNEATYTKRTALEAELRRRLWWSLIIFDNRICEMSDYKTTMLGPTWNCKTPLHVNDLDMRPEMKAGLAIHEQPTEALFAVVRSELSDFVRHSEFHLDFTNPSLKSIGPTKEIVELDALEKRMEDRYLRFCNLENPLHFVTVWTTRSYLAKLRLFEHYSRFSQSSSQQTEAQRNFATSQALSQLECDTKLTHSPLTKGYHWFLNMYFPFPAYLHIVQDLKRRPTSEHVENIWEVMSDNYEAHFLSMEQENPIFKVMSRIVLQAWEARVIAFRKLSIPLEAPRIVSDMKRRIAQTASKAQESEEPSGATGTDMGTDMDEISMPMPMDFGGHELPYGMGGQSSVSSEYWAYLDTIGQGAMEIDANHLDWATMDF